MTGARAAALLAVASLSCLLLSSPAASAGAGAGVAIGAAHSNIERIAGDPFLALSEVPHCLGGISGYLSHRCLRIVTSKESFSI